MTLEAVARLNRRVSNSLLRQNDEVPSLIADLERVDKDRVRRLVAECTTDELIQIAEDINDIEIVHLDDGVFADGADLSWGTTFPDIDDDTAREMLELELFGMIL